jgi:hypothetical protein
VAAYFRLKQASTYTIRTPKKLYTFTGQAPVRVTLPEDVLRLRNKPDVVEECDQKGLPLLDEPAGAGRASFTSKALSYHKLAKETPRPAPKPAPKAAPKAEAAKPEPVAPPAAPPKDEEPAKVEAKIEDEEPAKEVPQIEATPRADGEASETGAGKKASSGKALGASKSSKKSGKKSGKKGRRKSE